MWAVGFIGFRYPSCETAPGGLCLNNTTKIQEENEGSGFRVQGSGSLNVELKIQAHTPLMNNPCQAEGEQFGPTSPFRELL